MNKKLIKVVSIDDDQYPEQLRLISSPPKKLWYIGELSLVRHPHRLSVVGARKVSVYGRTVTRLIVEAVARHDVVTISGLALGVDSLAHAASLECREPTIAVLPCGLDTIYPRTHTELAQKIITSGGLLMSEYEPGTPPLRQHFIARNRIVSGLGQAVLITEAARKSGTLHTAQFALEQGRTVLAVPGNITNPMSCGTNALIKTGALTVTEPADVLLVLGISQNVSQVAVIAANEEESAVLTLLKSGVTEGSELHEKSNLSAAVFSQTLTMLEISGKIRPLGANNWSIS